MMTEVAHILIRSHWPKRTILLLLILIAAACSPWGTGVIPDQAPLANFTLAEGTATAVSASPTPVAEVEIQPIPLAGKGSKASAQISGLAWAGEMLVLLPQYPRKISGEGGGALLALPREDILAYLDNPSGGPLTPNEIMLDSGGIESIISGFEGFEAIAFAGSQAYLTIEASPFGGMKSYLVRGELTSDMTRLTLDASRIVEAQLAVQIPNFSHEAILIAGEQVILFYEANGALPYPQPRALVFDRELNPLDSIGMDNLEYRLTDATAPDSQGRFWVSNFFFPGDLATIPLSDPLAGQFGQGPSHARASVVERLVEMELAQDEQSSIRFSGRPPIQLRLAEGQIPRNWEGIARLEGRGFLLVTDQFPDTILAFVPYP